MSISARKKWRSLPQKTANTGLKAGGSIFYPNYLCQDTVYTRDISAMPLAANSSQINQYMLTHPSSGDLTGVHIYNYNLPIYVVDSDDPSTPRVTVNYDPNSGVTPTQTRQDIMFTTNIPMPSWARPAIGSDSSMAIYDIATGIMREYFGLEKQNDGTWMAFTGGYTLDVPSIATTNYSCQHNEGSDFAYGGMGSATQIGIEEARRGIINHALGMVVYNARKDLTVTGWDQGVISWPATWSDGTDTDQNAPCQSQWFRIKPSVDVDSLGLNAFTTMICKAVQQYGGFPVDKTLTNHQFNCEPGFNELHEKGVDPWVSGGDLYSKFSGDFSLAEFPWDKVEWAPVNWGKP